MSVKVVTCNVQVTTSGVQVDALARGPEDRDQFDLLVDRAEPVRGPGRELDGLTRLGDEVAVAEDQAQASRDHVEPLVALVNGELLRGLTAAGLDDDLEHPRPPRFTAELPHGHPVMTLR